MPCRRTVARRFAKRVGNRLKEKRMAAVRLSSALVMNVSAAASDPQTAADAGGTDDRRSRALSVGRGQPEMRPAADEQKSSAAAAAVASTSSTRWKHVVRGGRTPIARSMNVWNGTGSAAAVLAGVVAFIDYKQQMDNPEFGIVYKLKQLGACVEKIFNRKVTHVVFKDGHQRTYDMAKKRDIPLVSATWINECDVQNSLLDPADYPSVTDMEKYLHNTTKI